MTPQEALKIVETALMNYVNDSAGEGSEETKEIQTAFDIMTNIVNPSEEDIKINRAAEILSNDFSEIPDIIKKLEALEDDSVCLDFAIEEIIVWQPLEHYHTVASFLEQITP